jgi:hypothetical protein
MNNKQIIYGIEKYIKNHDFEIVNEFFSNNKMLFLDIKQSDLFYRYLKKIGFKQGVQDQVINLKLDKEFINKYYSCTHQKIIYEFINF